MYQKKLRGLGIDGIVKYAQILRRILSRNCENVSQILTFCSGSVIHFFGDGIVSAWSLLMCIINRTTNNMFCGNFFTNKRRSCLKQFFFKQKYNILRENETDEFHFKFKTSKNYFTNTLTTRLKCNRRFLLEVPLIIVVCNDFVFKDRLFYVLRDLN